jgi:hypothetical protein
VPKCDDGTAVANEECDNGDANDDTLYGGCTTKCKWGPFCDDGIVNGNEERDDGKDSGSNHTQGGCTLGCTKPHFCGDAIVDTDRAEECDVGPRNGVKLDADRIPDETG